MNTGSIWGDDGEDEDFEDDKENQVVTREYLTHISKIKADNAYIAYRRYVDSLKLELPYYTSNTHTFIYCNKSSYNKYKQICIEEANRRCALQMLQDAVNHNKRKNKH
tara:strand:+ start:52 stop:375 length:324 start_codon:yes stop_codon:yes gene_type:complete